MLLNEIKEKNIFKITEISKKAEVDRLSDLGLSVGASLSVLSITKGMFLVQIKNSVYAINDILAGLIAVEKCNR